MARVKRGTTSLRRRRNTLSQVKGYRFGRSKKERQAKEALYHAGVYAFAHRRNKKGDYRRMWQIKINAAVRTYGLSYSKFIDKLKKGGVLLDRKILADLAEHEPETFGRIVKNVTK